MEACNNQVLLRGTVAGEAALSHEAHGIPFYRVPLAVPRLSGREDRVNLLCPHAGPEDPLPPPGAYVEVSGEVRSFNNRSGVGSRLVITVLAREIRPGLGEPCNQVTLWGALCKPPVLRRTPLGRDICDLLLAVGRRYRRADYLPCIAWGSLAHLCGSLTVGNRVRLTGRLQSRLYSKTIEGRLEERTAFEVSIMSLTQEEVSSPPEPVLLHTQAAHAEGGL